MRSNRGGAECLASGAPSLAALRKRGRGEDVAAFVFSETLCFITPGTHQLQDSGMGGYPKREVNEKNAYRIVGLFPLRFYLVVCATRRSLLNSAISQGQPEMEGVACLLPNHHHGGR